MISSYLESLYETNTNGQITFPIMFLYLPVGLPPLRDPQSLSRVSKVRGRSLCWEVLRQIFEDFGLKNSKIPSKQCIRPNQFSNRQPLVELEVRQRGGVSNPLSRLLELGDQYGTRKTTGQGQDFDRSSGVGGQKSNCMFSVSNKASRFQNPRPTVFCRTSGLYIECHSVLGFPELGLLNPKIEVKS